MNKMRISCFLTALTLLFQLSIFQSVSATATGNPLLLLDYTEMDSNHFEVTLTVQDIPSVDVICLPIAWNSDAVEICGYNAETGEFFDIEDGVKFDEAYMDGSNGIVVYDYLVSIGNWEGSLLGNDMYPFIDNKGGITSSVYFSMSGKGMEGANKIMSVYFKRKTSAAPQIRMASYKNCENYDPAAKEGATFVRGGKNVAVEIKYNGDVFDGDYEIDYPEEDESENGTSGGTTGSTSGSTTGGTSGGTSGSVSGGNSSANNPPKSDSNSGIADNKTPETSISFTDVKSNFWAYTPVISLAESKIINGYSDGSFKPNNNITRAELAKIAVLAKGLETPAAQDLFKDVPAGKWYAPFITAAYNSKIVNGYPGNIFKPEINVSRQDLCVILYRAFFDGQIADKEVSFADGEKIATYAKQAVDYFAAQGIVNGKGGNNFAPADNATRAETAKIVYLCLEKVKS